jgi:hypothetical protein
VGAAWALLGLFIWVEQGLDTVAFSGPVLVLIFGNIGFTAVGGTDYVVGRIIRRGRSHPAAEVADSQAEADNSA